MVDSSPFLRCLQTASAIAKKININTIYINYLACEWLKDKFYPAGNPLGNLLVETTPSKDFQSKYLDVNNNEVKIENNSYNI